MVVREDGADVIEHLDRESSVYRYASAEEVGLGAPSMCLLCLLSLHMGRLACVASLYGTGTLPNLLQE